MTAFLVEDGFLDIEKKACALIKQTYTTITWLKRKYLTEANPDLKYYMFSWWDMACVMEGMMLRKIDKIGRDSDLYDLWLHECMRTLSDQFWRTEDIDEIAATLKA